MAASAMQLEQMSTFAVGEALIFYEKLMRPFTMRIKEWWGEIENQAEKEAMVSSKNYNKEEKVKSVFNLLKESEENTNYITYDSLENAAKALNLNINKEGIKNCFKKYSGYISLEKFEKLILDEMPESRKSEQLCEQLQFMPTIANENKLKKNSQLKRKKTS